MIGIYIALGVSVLLNVILGIALYKLYQKHYRTAKQLHWYNVCAGGRHDD